MKRLCSILCILLLCFSVFGCGGTKDKSNEIVKDTIQKQEQKQENKVPAVSSQAAQAAAALVQKKQDAVNKKDIEEFMNTVNTNDREYYAEERHWFQDIQVNDISGYKLEIVDITKEEEGSYLVDLNQTYTFGGKKKSLKYKAVFKDSEGGMTDFGLDFKEKETDHFIIKYMEKSEKLAGDFSRAAEEAYAIVKSNYGKVPEDKTVIKIYDDMETLRQFVKLSFQWDMAGWYEYSEAIKFIGWSSEVRAESLAHELIHKVTIKDTNNNMPYWLAEGLATHYTEKPIKSGSLKKPMSIEKLESIDLEALTDNTEISSYYKSAQNAVELIIGKYGEKALRDILQELSKHPFQDHTGSEVNGKNIQLFDEASKKVLGKSTVELDNGLEISETK
ncbi:MAG: peptidase MA family metallohydrolase [Bacillota bacterium]|nr:peptidase MA family metallohydrolase [Bacillota bacterium]